MNIIWTLLFRIIILLLIHVHSFVVEQYELKGAGILLDSNLSHTTLYRSSIRLEYANLSEVTRGSIFLKSENNSYLD